ncbi:hypothetical protein A2331_06400 [Candidatus Falkowbacteria bacterium RIFOXYB2_FULL_34_18]|uniref:Uncharacterized protein n=1 Tax=Candidatus Falkowbacteria bacterium RIFOXYD2_FULL_34_120 TaxID=1798007 RepID=A0A1F5TQE3_9BACT|nr:MAG: hypothetical protein A2331_06400 [Candidatus Falkowbacteria bacterium RIFOXYB2_FULL_34_18]OGF29399.1 MAG: hypothetical protein A2500_06490 [Candidatus Falkowbacteria bacterium RIFOXYC12_FULL_34_55]OGF36608.1 MAG: hypothetical protein A2466_06825 [Candidatus Falkowbacteria bacterium RIFOXYC2_FULL_34_220]OGF38826.1 MAG: hypothetical protein A2515_03270 [Candidatus Falkowbacteria bacterium RIFOXYD12_FULL_34_57]OGF41069.1 MAG: hypothetical protein A2531_03225 [Candidatus Falkowbacteria bact
MDLSIVIVQYKTKEKTLKCLRSVYDSDIRDLQSEIIVVDNDSRDGIGEIIKKNFRDVIFIQNDKNIGMGAGNNSGIKHATGKYILILNADIVVSENSIFKLYNYIKNHKDVGLVAPKLLNPNGSMQQSCFRFPTFFLPLYRRTFMSMFGEKRLHYFLMKDFDYASIKEVDWIMGSCFILEKKLIDKLGGFDERFFMYLEDTDLCKRVWKSKLKIIYNPEINVIHDHGRGSAKQAWYIGIFTNKLAREHIKSWLKYFWKWGKWFK